MSFILKQKAFYLYRLIYVYCKVEDKELYEEYQNPKIQKLTIPSWNDFARCLLKIDRCYFVRVSWEQVTYMYMYATSKVVVTIEASYNVHVTIQGYFLSLAGYFRYKRKSNKKVLNIADFFSSLHIYIKRPTKSHA